MKDYRTRRAEKCREAFDGFLPDFSKCRNPDEAETILRMARDGYLSAEIAEALGKTPKAVQKFFRRYNFPNLQNIENLRMHEQPMWNGGIKMMKGYQYKRTPGHPNGTKHGCYVAVHRLVMEEKLGRYLLRTEVVDHIDGDILNNSPDNLRVFASNAEHLAATLKGRCPNWSVEGRKRLDEVRQHRRQKALSRKSGPSRAV